MEISAASSPNPGNNIFMRKAFPGLSHLKLSHHKKKRKLNVIKEYLEQSSLHGIKYIGMKKSFGCQRLFWAIMVTLSATACFYQVYKIWKKWEESPIILSFGDNLISVSEVPFPAVTVCNDIGIKKDIIKKKKSMSSEDRLKVTEMVNLTCGFHSGMYDKFNHSDIEKYFQIVSSNLNDTVANCSFISNYNSESCMERFSPTFTNRGLCYTFNGLRRSDLFKEGVRTLGWWNKTSSEAIDISEGYPLNTSDAGPGNGLTFQTVVSLPYFVNSCPKIASGYKIILHNPVELPHRRHISYMVSSGAEVTIMVRPEYITTSDKLRSISPERRQCFFEDERQLEYFKEYTQDNCALECLTQITLKMCGCVAFYMPVHEDTNIEICSSSNECFEYIKKTMIKEQREKNECKCLPACTEIKYKVENSHSFMKDTNTNNNRGASGMVEIVFTDQYFITQHRRELFGRTDFFASCGGILGLFLGFSVLSMVELAYYVTIYFINLKKQRELSNASSIVSTNIVVMMDKSTECEDDGYNGWSHIEIDDKDNYDTKSDDSVSEVNSQDSLPIDNKDKSEKEISEKY